MTYRDVVSRQVLTWACTAIGARMPVAMAPLALVFLVRERPGGYSLGALAAGYSVMYAASGVGWWGEVRRAGHSGSSGSPGRSGRAASAVREEEMGEEEMREGEMGDYDAGGQSVRMPNVP
ncbi:hypothetical protein [Streptomyces sp. NBC_01515]|uniref:hypothetical protein n=1 Tax=Streptomyces sp. NBC_01515 TaxID=2903890 RepID=UPI003865DD9F